LQQKKDKAIAAMDTKFLQDAFQIFAFNSIGLIGSSTSASIWPHKKAVKKIEAEGF
jgi:hypothetical protein